jgi:hypothetical protein
MTMLILLGGALFGFGLLLFGLGVTVYLIGLILRVFIRLFQFGLLLVLAGIAFASWIRQRKKVVVLEGEVLPPQRALPDRRPITPLLFAGMMVLAVSAAQADVVVDDRQYLIVVRPTEGGVRADPHYGLIVKAEADNWQDRAADAVAAAKAESEGFWVGPRYYWSDGRMSTTVYDKRYRAYTYLDRSVPTMADAPSWLRYPPRPR